LAMRHGRDRSQLLDLIQEGNVGLLEALRRFEPAKEVRFATYARHWVRAMMLKHVMDNHRIVRVGSTRAGRKLFFQLRKESRRLEQSGVEPTAEVLARRLGVDVSEVWAVQASMNRPAMSLDSSQAG